MSWTSFSFSLTILFLPLYESGKKTLKVAFDLYYMYHVVFINPPNNPLPVCLGNAQTLTCNVTGNVLLWRFNRSNSETATYSSITNPPRPIGPVTTSLSEICQIGGATLITSKAMFTMTNTLNETLLECGDGFFAVNTTAVKNVVLVTQSKFNIALPL